MHFADSDRCYHAFWRAAMPSRWRYKAFVRSFWAHFVPQILFCEKKISNFFLAKFALSVSGQWKISPKMSKFYIFTLSILTLNKVFPPSKSRISELFSSPKPILSGFLRFSHVSRAPQFYDFSHEKNDQKIQKKFVPKNLKNESYAQFGVENLHH